MGLLDFNAEQPGGIFGGLLSDPGARLGLSMLAASSPRLRGLNDVMASQDRMQQQALQQQYLQSQLDENKSQAKLREQQVAMAQQKQNLLANLFGGGGGGPLAGVSTGGGINVPASGGGGGLQNMTLDQVAMLKANGIDVSDLWKTGREGFKREAGAYYEGVNGETKYMPKLDSGMAVSGGQVVVAPGYAQANAGIKGSEAGAVEAAKFPYAVGQDSARQNLSARLDATKVYNPQTGREEFVPRSAVVAQPQFSGAGYAGGSAAAAAPEQLQIMQSELNRLPPNHPDRPAIMREMQRLGGGQQVAQSGNFAAGPSADEAASAEALRARMVGTAKADVERDTGRQSEAKRYGQLTAGIDRAIDLLNQGPTASGVGALVDKGLGSVGASTRGSVAASQLETLSGWLVSNVPRMEGPQSNVDVLNYQTMAGTVGDRTRPIAERLAAAQEVKKLQDKYASLNGGGGGNAPAKEQPQQAAKEFSMLPKATEFDGKRMRAPDGSIYRSTGGKWVKE